MNLTLDPEPNGRAKIMWGIGFGTFDLNGRSESDAFLVPLR